MTSVSPRETRKERHDQEEDEDGMMMRRLHDVKKKCVSDLSRWGLRWNGHRPRVEDEDNASRFERRGRTD